MSGFGLRALKKHSEENSGQNTRQYIKHLVYGENIAGILTYAKLSKLYPGEVKLITRNPYYKNEIEQELYCTLNSIRDKAVAEKISKLFPEIELRVEDKDVIFYKDTKFHKFGARAKPHNLKEEEKFFQKPYFEFNSHHLIESSEEFEQNLLKDQLNKIIANIEVKTPEDLVEKTNFRLITGESEYLDCENLYFCESPKKFFQLVSNKTQLPDSICEFIAPLTNYRAICVYFECDNEVMNMDSTMIIPQSMTHEWGSFVLDFEKFNADTKTQNIKALSFVHEDDVQEEDLAKKIRLMQKVIERVIPEFSKVKVKQTIKYNDEFLVDGINDDYFKDLAHFNIKFIGSSAPIDCEHSESYQYLARTLVSLESISSN